MAGITIRGLSKSFGARRGSRGRRRHRPRDQGQFLCHAARTLGLRQDHDAAPDRRLHHARSRHHRSRRPAVVVAGSGGAAGIARHGHGVPELRGVAAQDGLRERRVRSQAAQGAGRGRRASRSRRRSRWSISAGLEDRYPNELSGGQQQRVALARSLVVEPGILLLDEPLSNLDAKLRERMRSELKELQRRTGITFVYVTHDQAEALALSDQIAVMNSGRLQQFGTPLEVYARPANRMVADFMGLVNLVPGEVRDLRNGGGSGGGRPTLRWRSPRSTGWRRATPSTSRSGRRISAAAGGRRAGQRRQDHQPRLSRQYQRILRHAAVRSDAAGADPSARSISRSATRSAFAVDATQCSVFRRAARRQTGAVIAVKTGACRPVLPWHG